MAKIFSILTLLAAGLALYLGLESGKRVKELQTAGERQVGVLRTTQGTLAKTEATLKTTEADLATTTATLETTRAELASTKDKLSTAENALATAKQEAATATTQLAEIKKAIEDALPGGLVEISNLKAKMTELTDAKTAAEAKVANLEKDKATLEATVQTLEGSVKSADEKIAQQGTTIKKYTDNIMQKGIRGRVMAVNSGWGFCVLSVGDRQGAAANKIMIVARGGRAIGKVRITNVEATQSVADILPSTFVRGTFVQPGDEVIYTGDDKVAAEEPAAEPAAAGAAPQPELPRQ